ncbi:hypothetical protein WN51_09218 [Melipona quadrifasciata]|uniref:Nuclear pore complex protein Nup214 n=1 Tax=Melipona quadrifasciata TaxID=166423 RepID=A0A0M9A8G8_9HYME|nr:hypothetical protein WN51_09218 [Melipona quadrifasciata]
MKTASDPKDIQDFQFKQSCTSQILDAFISIPTACSLLAADKKRGLLYAGQNNKIIILKPGDDTNPEWKIEFNLSLVVSKLTLNCDCSYLAVAFHEPMVLIYDAQALTKNSLQLLHKIRISTSNGDIFANDLRWNPAVPGMLCTIASDYTIGSFRIKEKKKEAIELKALEKFNDDINALCAAWSPKGKQIVVGCKNGNIVQFKPDLKIARTILGPNPYIGEVVNILWISNYQFCAAYFANVQGINVLIIDAPKEWGLIIAASSNSSEIAVLGSTDKGVTWNQWQLVDSGRAELPLIHTTESYPVGLAIDRSSIKNLPWGADSTLPHPVPILHILATSGQLCSFHMVNLTPNCPPINSPPTEIIANPLQIQSTIGSETSFIMSIPITSTPIARQQENALERSKPVAGNILNKFIQKSNFTLSPTEKPKQEHKSEQPSIGMKLEPTREIQSQEIVKPDIKLTAVKEIITHEPVEPKPSADDDAKDNRAYIEEHNLFEKELRNRLEPQILEYDTEEERRKLIDTSIIIDKFLRELKETTNSLSSDIAYLKALLLQSFAWVEETKSKNAATNDITTRNCGDNNKISDLQKLYYYTQTQLTQASKILDLEWSNHKSQEMSRMKIPYLEFVYQNLILHSKIIQEEKSKVEYLKKRWKLIIRSNSIFGLNRSLSNLTITSSKTLVTLPRNTGIIEARCKAIASKTLSFTQEKQIKLREHLSTCTPKIIKPVNPSSIQHRLEATLSSLTSPNTANINIKNKVDQPVSKQSTIAKQQNLYIDPLDSMASIVAGIGTNECTNESNNVSTQNKIQSKQPSFGITFPPVSGSKPVQIEKISSMSTTTTVLQNSKPKQDTITLNQMHTSSNLMKSFPKVDTITFDTSAQKSEGTAAQSSTIQSMWLHTIKPENTLFSDSLKDVLPSETSIEKIQTTTPNTGMTLPITAAKTKAISTFSFATPIVTTQNTFVTSQTTNAQTFSFASKPSNITTPFNLKMTPPKSQTQDVLSLAGSFTGLQTTNQASSISANNSIVVCTTADEKYNSKLTFGIPGVSSSDGNQISVANKLCYRSVTIEEVPLSESTSSLPTSTVQDLREPSATPLFSILKNTLNTSVCEEISNSTPTITICAVTTATPVTQTTITSAMPLFGGFFTTSNTTTNITSSTITPFQSALSKPFDKTAPVFDKPSLTMNSQFSTTPAVSSTANTFEKPDASIPLFKPFGNSSNTFMFGKMTTASTSDSIFSGSNTNSIFGGNTQVSSSGSIFGGNTSSINTFGVQMSIFDNNAPKSDSIFDSASNTGSASFFSGATNNTSALSLIGSSVFGGSAANTSSMGVEQPVLGVQPIFGQTPSFNTKPVFGSAATFGPPKPIFSGGFGTTPSPFGISATTPAFGSPPTMGGSPAPIDNNMPKVFGNVGGSSTFESLANQSGGLSFSSLAQKSTDVPKSPVFTSGSSFSTWR